MTDINTLTEAQWKRVISNMYTVGQEETQFSMDRQRNLTITLLEFNRQFRRNYNVQEVLSALGDMAIRGQNVTDLPNDDARRVIFDTDMALQANRERMVVERYARWEEVYERCKRGQSQVLPPVQIPPMAAGEADAVPNIPGSAPGTAPGGAPGQVPVVPGGGVRPMQG